MQISQIFGFLSGADFGKTRRDPSLGAENSSNSRRSSAQNTGKESFKKVYEEFNQKVPDRTTTIEEKELALSYIERILNSDADADTKAYWQSNAIVIKAEIAKIKQDQAIKNVDEIVISSKTDVIENVQEFYKSLEMAHNTLMSVWERAESSKNADLEESCEAINIQLCSIEEKMGSLQSTVMAMPANSKEAGQYAEEIVAEMKKNLEAANGALNKAMDKKSMPEEDYEKMILVLQSIESSVNRVASSIDREKNDSDANSRSNSSTDSNNNEHSKTFFGSLLHLRRHG